MKQLLAVVGTDTAVGKTIVTAAIAASFLAAGMKVRVLKPVQTGFPHDDDAAEVNRRVGATVARRGVSLRGALGPVVAGRLEGRPIVASEVEAWVRESVLDDGLTLLETAGGVAVELSPGYDMAALVAAVTATAVLVCRPSLGTLNHTVLSLRHLRQAGVQVAGLVISGFPAEPGAAELTNPAELERLTGLDLIGVIPLLADMSPPAFALAARRGLGPALGGDFARLDWLAGLAGSVPV